MTEQEFNNMKEHDNIFICDCVYIVDCVYEFRGERQVQLHDIGKEIQIVLKNTARGYWHPEFGWLFWDTDNHKAI